MPTERIITGNPILRQAAPTPSRMVERVEDPTIGRVFSVNGRVGAVTGLAEFSDLNTRLSKDANLSDLPDKQAALNALLGATGTLARGDAFFFDGANVARLPAGTPGSFLKTMGASASPEWAAVDLSAYAPLANAALTGIPTAPTAAPGTSTTQLATTAFTQAAISNLIAAAPGALDTLDELAAALGDDANFAATVTTSLAGKQPLAANLTSWSALTRGTGFDTAAALAANATGGFFTQGSALSATTVTASGEMTADSLRVSNGSGGGRVGYYSGSWQTYFSFLAGNAIATTAALSTGALSATGITVGNSATASQNATLSRNGAGVLLLNPSNIGGARCYGTFDFSNDNVVDIGGASANRPRDINLARNLIAGGTVTAGSLVIDPATGQPSITMVTGSGQSKGLYFLNDNDLSIPDVHVSVGYSLGLRGVRGAVCGIESGASGFDMVVATNGTLTLGGGACTSVILAKPLSSALSLTGSQATNALELSPTWNTTGNPSLIYGRVTNTASGASANLIDLGTVAGGSLFRVDKSGVLSVPTIAGYPNFTGGITFETNKLLIAQSGIVMNASTTLSWGPNASYSGSDTRIRRTGTKTLTFDDFSGGAATFAITGHLNATGTITHVPAASATPANNGEFLFERTSNTTVTAKLKGTDGTVRSCVLTFA